MTTVLVIEDEQDIRVNIIEVLTLQNLKLLEATNGLIGLELAIKHLPDLIICDINMPELDGYEVLHSLRNNPSTATIPFIFLTAQADKDFMRQGMNLGADDYLTKPFSWEELITAITVRLEKHDLVIKENEQKLDDLRGNILHALPHELRTPLTGIIGSAELIVEHGEKMDRAKIIGMGANILESAERLYHLTENYFLYAQLEIIRSDPERVKAIREDSTENPEEVIVEVAKRQAAKLQRESDLIIRSGNVPSIQISTDNLQKIIEELTDNALKFSRNESSIEIEIGIKDTFYFRISDNGRGMTAQQIKNIAPYIQFERKIYEQQGSGLGLSIASSLTKLHGGQMLIESELGNSTTITVTLPLT